MTAPTATPTTTGEASPEPRLRGPVRNDVDRIVRNASTGS